MSFLGRFRFGPRPRRFGLALAGITLATGLLAQSTADAPLRDVRMPVIDKEGTRIFDLSAAAMRTFSDKPIRIELTNVHLIMYDVEKPGTQVGQLFAAIANYDGGTKIVSGPDQLHAIYHDVDLYGNDWTYDPKAKSLVIQHDVVVTFPGDLGHILR